MEKNFIIYEKLYPQILEKAKSPLTFNTLRKIFVNFFNKNHHVLQSNIVGRQLLLNKDMEDDVLSVLELNHSTVKKIIAETKYKKTQLVNQYIFALPLVLLSEAYMELGKKEESTFIYFCTFFKPYASRVARYFQFFNDKNEAHMLYVIENIANNKFDIRKYGTVIEALQKRAESSYDNYKSVLMGKPTDKDYEIIFESGIYSRVNDFIKNIAEIFYDPKNKEEITGYQATSVTVVDSDDVEDNIALDNRNDSAVKFAIASKAVKKFLANPIDVSLVAIAAEKGFSRISTTYQDYLKEAITNVIENHVNVIQEFFECILGSFLFNENPATGKKFTPADIKTIRFIAGAFNIFTHTHTTDINILRTKELLNLFLENSTAYNKMSGNTMKTAFKNALFMYFVLIIKKAA